MNFTVWLPYGATNPRNEAALARWMRFGTRNQNADAADCEELYPLGVFKSRRQAESLAACLRSCTHDHAWEVTETEAPLQPATNPVLVLFGPTQDGETVTFTVSPFSRALLEFAFPDAVPEIRAVEFNRECWATFCEADDCFAAIVEFVEMMTGLTTKQIAEQGLRLLADADEELILDVAATPAGDRAVASP